MPAETASPGITIISEMITPALLILACGSLLSTVLARLARVNDHVRALAQMMETSPGAANASNRETLTILQRRADLCEISMGAYFIAVTLFVGTCLLIAIDRLVAHAVYWAPVTTSVLGVALLLIGSSFMIAECRLAVRDLKHELDGIWQQIEKDSK
jgi:hypothetical protein